MNDETKDSVPQSDEEREQEYRDQLKRLRVVDLAYEMMVSLVTVGYQKLGLTDETRDLRDLDDAHLAIELLRAILAEAEKAEGAEGLKDLRSTVAQMQLGYVQAMESSRKESTASPDAEASPEDAGGEPAADSD